MTLRQSASWLAGIPLLALVVFVGVVVGAPERVLPALADLWPAAPEPTPQPVAHSGRVMRDGKAVANATVQITLEGGQVVTVTTDAEGWYNTSPPKSHWKIPDPPPNGPMSVDAPPISTTED